MPRACRCHVKQTRRFLLHRAFTIARLSSSKIVLVQRGNRFFLAGNFQQTRITRRRGTDVATEKRQDHRLPLGALGFLRGDKLKPFSLERRTSRGVRKSARNFAAKSSSVAPSASAAAVSARRASRSLSALGKSSCGKVARRSRNCVRASKIFTASNSARPCHFHACFCQQSQRRRNYAGDGCRFVDAKTRAFSFGKQREIIDRKCRRLRATRQRFRSC